MKRSHMLRLTVCLFLLFAGLAAADEPVGIEVLVEDTLPGSSVARCTVTWERPAAVARLTVRGAEPFGVSPGSQVVAHPTVSSTWTAEWSKVEGGDAVVAFVDLGGAVRGEPVLLIAERGAGALTWQVVVRLALTESGPAVESESAYRFTHLSGTGTGSAELPAVARRSRDAYNDLGAGAIFVEPLAKTAATASVFLEDNAAQSIQDGPGDCTATGGVWPNNRVLWIGDAPVGADSTAITVHVTITHAVMANLQVAMFYDPNVPAGSGKFLWMQDAGVNLDRDFTEDYFGQDLPGLGQSVNGYYILGARDCVAGTVGTLDYWSLLVEYEGDPTIDLVADSVTPAVTEAAPGDTIAVSWQGHVAGSGTVGASFNVAFYLSTDTGFSGDDVLLGQATESTANLPGDLFGESSPGRSLTIPAATAAGGYNILMLVDIGDAIDEANEGNNMVASPLTVAIPDQIDIVADSVTALDTSVAAGGSFRVAWQGHVGGTGTVGGHFAVGFYLSTDSTINSADLSLARRTDTWATSSGDVFGESSYDLSIPGSTAPGTYYVGLIVDVGNLIPESNEGNNIVTFYPLTVSEPGTVNLSAVSCSVAAAAVVPGASTSLTWQGRNLGTTVTGSFTWVVYLSTDQTLSPGTDRILTQQAVGSGWAAGYDTGQVTTAVTIPSDVAVGEHYLGVHLDSDDTVAESNENDNWCAKALDVEDSASPTSRRYLIAAAASAPGYGTSDWRTQVAVANPGTVDRQASFYFVARGASWPGTLLSGPHTLRPGQSVYLEDPLLALNPVTGLIYVSVDDSGPAVTSRTFNLGDGGATFGQGIPAIPLDDVAAPAELVLPMVHSVPGLFHTNLGLVQAAAGSYTVEVSIYSQGGTLLAIKSYTKSTAYDQVNDVFGDMGIGQTSVVGGWIRVRLTSGTPEFWTCYASVVDDLTGDPTYVAPVGQ